MKKLRENLESDDDELDDFDMDDNEVQIQDEPQIDEKSKPKSYVEEKRETLQNLKAPVSNSQKNQGLKKVRSNTDDMVKKPASDSEGTAEKKRDGDKKESPDHLRDLDKLIQIAIICMEKKRCSKPMKKILGYLDQFSEVQINQFTEDLILNQPVDEWPKCDVLICFYSAGFPIEKTLKYTQQHKPIQINDLESQKILWDRREIYRILKENNIPLSRHFIVNRKDQPVLDQQYLEDHTKTTEGRGEYLIQYAKEQREKFENPADLDNLNEEDSKSELQNFDIDQLDKDLVLKNSNSENLTKNQKIATELDDMNMPAKEELLYSDPELDFQEYEDFIMFNGEKLYKPFVEKPVNAEDHEIKIYYSALNPCGSGYNVLFRKTNDFSGQFIPQESGISTIRKTGSYIYEEFLPTDGFDLKIYTVGPDYAHAEARKCPTLDGVVQRDKDGKEVRYPVNLSQPEKQFARTIQRAFKQSICGFDLLRSKGKSYVCDVNGFSLVKSSNKYYIDCASQIRKIISSKFRRSYNNLHELMATNPLQPYHEDQGNDKSYRPDKKHKGKIEWELRAVVGVFRHGDRTPKQKMKMKTKNPIFLKFFEGAKNQKKEVKLKTPAQLQKLLDITRKLITQIFENNIHSKDIANVEKEREWIAKLIQLRNVLERDKFEGLNRKVQLKPIKWNADNTKVIECLFVLKWGGVLTHSGVKQAQNLGESFREEMYVEDKKLNDGGLLRLHSTYRHDLKCYTSDEGRCQKTAAAFLKGLLFLEGALAPVLAIMVRNDEVVQCMLNDSTGAEPMLKKVKVQLNELFHSKVHMYQKYKEMFKEEPTRKLQGFFKDIGVPILKLQEIQELIQYITGNMKVVLDQLDPWQTQTYLYTSAEFEKIFNIEQPIDSKDQLVEQIEQYSNEFMAKDLKRGSKSFISEREISAQKQKENNEDNSEAGDNAKANKKKKEKNTLSGAQCESETLLMMFKRWKKIEEDFNSNGKDEYDISKLPEIYDNIVYDMIHYPDLRDSQERNKLLRLSQLMCMVNVPSEYGITKGSKLKIGMSITKLLIDKIHGDLVWWKGQDENISNRKDKFNDENQASGLDHRSLDQNSGIKSHWRHVRSRFYFTSASHMYTLLNVLKFGMKQLNGDGDRSADTHGKLDDVHRLEFMCGVYFRVFENLNCDTHDPQRFRLELKFSRGSSLPDSIEGIEDHVIPIKLENCLTKTLTLEDVDIFFNTLLDYEESVPSQALDLSAQMKTETENCNSNKDKGSSQYLNIAEEVKDQISTGKVSSQKQQSESDHQSQNSHRGFEEDDNLYEEDIRKKLWTNKQLDTQKKAKIIPKTDIDQNLEDLHDKYQREVYLQKRNSMKNTKF